MCTSLAIKEDDDECNFHYIVYIMPFYVYLGWIRLRWRHVQDEDDLTRKRVNDMMHIIVIIQRRNLFSMFYKKSNPVVFFVRLSSQKVVLSCGWYERNISSGIHGFMYVHVCVTTWFRFQVIQQKKTLRWRKVAVQHYIASFHFFSLNSLYISVYLLQFLVDGGSSSPSYTYSQSWWWSQL